MGTTDNQTADILNCVIQALLSGGEKAAEAYLTALDPVLLANPIMSWLMDVGVQYIGQILSIAGQKFVDQLVIDAQVNYEKSGVLDAGTALTLAMASKDQAAIDMAKANLSAAYQAIISFDGWSHPA